MTTERIVQHCGWKTDGGGLLHRLKYITGTRRSWCGQWITPMEIPYSEFEYMGKCKKCFPNQAPPKTP